MKVQITWVLLVFQLCLFGANTQIDSLENILQSDVSLSGGQKCDVLILLSKKYLRVSPQKSVDYGKAALELANQIGDDVRVASALKNIGSAYYVQSDFVQGLDFFKQALQINLQINNRQEIAACYNNIGLIYNNLGYYQEALKNHLNQLKINEEDNNLKGIVISKRNIGNIYNNLRENDKAIDYYISAHDISEKLGDTNSVATTLINLGAVSMEMNEFDKALEFFDKALKIKERVQDVGNIAIIYSNLGVIQRSLGNSPLAIIHLQKALQLYESLNNKQGCAIAMINIADVYLKMKNFKISHDYLMSALDFAIEIDAKKVIRDVYKMLAEWYKVNGDYKKSLEYFALQSALQDSLFSLEKSMQIRNLQIVYEVEKKEKEILEQRVSIQKLKNSQIYLGLTVLIVLAAIFVVYLRFRLKQKINRQLEIKIAEALRKQNEQQQIIVHQASLTSLGELAAGIAHEIKQPLQSISLASESLGMEIAETRPDMRFMAGTVKEILEDIKRIKFIINEISNFSRGQQDSFIEAFDANNRIKNAYSLARTRFSNHMIDVIFNLDENLPDIVGNPYKFEQVMVNFLNNAKDAIEEKAGKVDFDKQMLVKSFTDGQYVVIEVTDNGAGVPENIKTNIFLPFFTTKPLGKGTGLGLSISLGIIKEMNGFIELESEEMKGTTMRVKIPVGNK